MPTQSVNHIICVGVVYIDTILTVPHFPVEDTKVRAKRLTRRRGGNTGNTLEVLAQLLTHDPQANASTTNLHLLSVLPNADSAAVTLIRASLPGVDVLSSSIFRPAATDAASSYIVQSAESHSRTIISVNELEEMRVAEFVGKVEARAATTWRHGDGGCWFHFEGRIPDVTVQCVRYLRSSGVLASARISVECEKPERADMAQVAQLADVVFYSKLWALKQGFSDATAFLAAQLHAVEVGVTLCCTWGAGGAAAMRKSGKSEEEVEWADVRAWEDSVVQNGQVVETIGAGDTFIAGMLFALNNHEEWTLQEKLEFANQLAGRKVRQEGFDDLGRAMWEAGVNYLSS